MDVVAAPLTWMQGHGYHGACGNLEHGFGNVDLGESLVALQ